MMKKACLMMLLNTCWVNHNQMYGLNSVPCLLKGAMERFFMFKLFATCQGIYFQVFRLGYLYLGRVCFRVFI